MWVWWFEKTSNSDINLFFLAHFDVGESLWDLGLSNEKLKDQQAVSNKILELENQMDLILVSEKFDESLILLKLKRPRHKVILTCSTLKTLSSFTFKHC